MNDKPVLNLTAGLLQIRDNLQSTITSLTKSEDKLTSLNQEIKYLNSLTRKSNVFNIQIQSININIVSGIFAAISQVDQLIDRHLQIKETGSLPQAVQDLEISMIDSAVRQCDTVTDAARMLGVKRTTLVEKMRTYRLKKEANND